ncbi:MAG: phosphoenolpyruvate synthase [Gemmatimonadales bacterium]|nr:MAG: phosphoenolpyruvate synthase [Gemmatimonadales bacterium]
MEDARHRPLVRRLEDVTNDDVAEVGGKNASLGEMIRDLGKRGVRVPGGFATTAWAYQHFLAENGLHEPLAELIGKLRNGDLPLPDAGKAIRDRILAARMPEVLSREIRAAYQALSAASGRANLDVAVRSSATAEDLPEASFAGQQESYLNVVGEDDLLEACQRCFASLFTDRAISYRERLAFDHLQVSLSVGVQKMVRSDEASAGVLFTLDPDSGFPRMAVITSSWGLGESVVKGTVSPDQFSVFKPVLGREGLVPILERNRGSKEEKVIYDPDRPGGTVTVATSEAERASLSLEDDEVLTLARWGVIIEDHYGFPMDIEWAKDGRDGLLYIVQARPETVHHRAGTAALRSYSLTERSNVLVRGTAVGDAIAQGRVFRIHDPSDTDHFEAGGILVTERTDPDWGPILNRAGGVITDQGSRTSHAAIVSRELGIPAVVGTGNGMETLVEGQEVTLSCAEGDEGLVYEGLLAFESTEEALDDLPVTRTRIMMNMGNPAAAFRWWRLPTRGIGLARMEFIIGEIIKAHPMALLHPDRLSAGDREAVATLTRGYERPEDYFVDHLARGIGKLAAVGHPDPVVVRLSDFKTNEYAGLLGGAGFEPAEENPMLGFRGACRYHSDRYRDAFALECRALRRVRNEMGFDNVILMVPFCRTLKEADRVLEVLAENGLVRGENGLAIYVMCEVPSNVVLVEEFAERFDGFSIGSNDLTQLVLGVDRDSGAKELTEIFDERDPAVVRMIQDVIRRAHAKERVVGICGQAPSDHADFAEMLVSAGIDSISLNPDTVPAVLRRVGAFESTSGSGRG